MPAPSWEDPDDFLDADEFGVQAVITLQGGGAIALVVLFNDPSEEAEAGEFTYDTSGPHARCREDLVGAVARGDSIAIQFPAGVQTFDVLAAPRPDGTGFAVLPLAKP